MSEALLKQHAPWSLSKSDLAAKCTLAFQFRYIDKYVRTEGTAAKVGTCAHKVVELMLKQTPPRDALAQAVAAQPNLTDKEQEQVEELLESLIAYVERIDVFKAKNPVEDEFFEVEWAINDKFEACAYDDPSALFRGVIDHCLLLKSGYLLVIDHKSGRHRGYDYYQKQLDAYAVLALAAKPHIKGVQAAIHYMKFKDLVWGPMRLAKYIVDPLRPWLRNLLTQRAGLLQVIQPNTDNLCRYCDYLAHCSTGQAHVAELDAQKAASKPTRSRARKTAG